MKKFTDPFIKVDPQGRTFICQGEWTLSNISALNEEIKKITWSMQGDVTIDGQAITKMDSAGAWLIDTLLKTLRERHIGVTVKNFSEQHEKLLALVEKQVAMKKEIPPVYRPTPLERLGRKTISRLKGIRDYLHFIGELTLEVLRTLARSVRMRWSDLAGVIEKAGYEALPIIALLSFMIGVVISYQMGNQLRNYGANIFIVNLLGFSVLREFGPLLTAIMVTGRTGSAFTAQIGMMKVNQEIDALNTMGVTPADLLVMPRMVGLILVMPLLTIWADIFGILGGMMMAHNMLNISWYEFLTRFQSDIPLRNLMIGLGKAPVFALLIGSIGCFQGMIVQGSADSVGRRTTKSVVWSIFFIIVVDAAFSIILSKLKL